MIHTPDECAAIMESADSWGMRNRKTGKNKVQRLGWNCVLIIYLLYPFKLTLLFMLELNNLNLFLDAFAGADFRYGF